MQAHELELAGGGALYPTVTAGASTTRDRASLARFGSQGTSLFTVNPASVRGLCIRYFRRDTPQH
jgi:hypothetical protein